LTADLHFLDLYLGLGAHRQQRPYAPSWPAYRLCFARFVVIDLTPLRRLQEQLLMIVGSRMFSGEQLEGYHVGTLWPLLLEMIVQMFEIDEVLTIQKLARSVNNMPAEPVDPQMRHFH
jgi:hypothetical protein